MNKNKNRFVFAKEDIIISETISIDMYDVGIIIVNETESEDFVFMVRIWQKVKFNTNKFEFFKVTETGDAFPDKICNICHKLLPTTLFAKNQNGINNRTIRRPSCQDCRKHLEGTEMSAKEKREWLKKKPHNEPFECPICNKRTIAGVTCKIVLDHNHKTGGVRGYICDSCNTGIGRFKDDIELLQKAIKHLE